MDAAQYAAISLGFTVIAGLIGGICFLTKEIVIPPLFGSPEEELKEIIEEKETIEKREETL